MKLICCFLFINGNTKFKKSFFHTIIIIDTLFIKTIFLEHSTNLRWFFIFFHPRILWIRTFYMPNRICFYDLGLPEAKDHKNLAFSSVYLFVWKLYLFFYYTRPIVQDFPTHLTIWYLFLRLNNWNRFS